MRTGFARSSSSRHLVTPLLLAALLVPAQATDMLKISEQLDQLDRMEMQELLRKADGCIQTRNFTCAEAALLKAKKLAKGNANMAEWQRTDSALVGEKDKVAQERAAALAAEQQRERERQRLAVEQERARREEERLAAMERDNAEDAAPSPGAQIAAFGALVLQNYANNSAALRAQQLAQQQANEAARERQRAAATERQQHIADERARLAAEQAGRERRQLADASAEKSRAERAAAEQEERRRALVAEETRLRVERERAERQAKQEADKAVARKELGEFHAGMLRGIRLTATKCPDGAGHYYATGSAPRIKEPVSAPSCIDVTYEASCPSNQPPIRGIAKNFVGMSGCFGDTYQIDPKPSCDVKDVRVKVTSVESCS